MSTIKLLAAAKTRKQLFLILLTIIMGALSISLGRYPISLTDIIYIIISNIFGLKHEIPEVVETVVFKIRLPRIFAAFLIGGSLSVAGASYQGIFNNPLVSPDILGVSAGAGFGAAVAILLSFNITGIQTVSFITGILAVIITIIISSKIKHGNQVLVIVLIGILVGTVFSSLISLTKFIADPYDKLPAITFWLMGSLTTITIKEVLMIIPPIILGLVPIYLIRWKLNVLSFGDEEAQTLGVDTKKTRLMVITCTTLLTASSVAVSGIIGWVGLVVPHMTRVLVGPDQQFLIPASFLLGGSFLLLVDTIARVLLPMEIPLGILTSLIGAPFFVWILYIRRGWK